MLLAFLLLLVGSARGAVTVLDRAQSVQGDAVWFPVDVPATAVPLPTEWASALPRAAGPVWYRLRFDAPAGDEPLALHVEQVCTNFEVQLNGARLYSGGRLVDPVTRNCHYPQWIPLSPALLRPEGNRLDIKVVGLPLQQVASRERSGRLSAIELGPQSELRERYESRLWWNATLPQIVAAALLLLGVLMLAVGWLNRREGHLLYFGLLAIGWAVLSARIWLREAPVGGAAIEWLVVAFVPLVAACAVQFLLRYAGLSHRAVDAALIAQCAIVPASLAVAGPDRVFLLARSWYVVLAIEVAIAAWVYLWYAWRAHRREFWPMVVLLAGAALVVAIELAVQQRWLAVPGLHVLHVALALAFIALGLWLMQQYAQALGAAEAGRSTLESRVAEISTEIERNYAQLAELRVEQVTERERKRIAGDLHDDLGAKLLTIVHTSESERISTLAREALEEMRLSVRGLTGKPVRLADALGDWRAEVMGRLTQSGVSADWYGPPEEPQQTLSSRAYVQTTRILREAVSNVIKHSRASRCTVNGAIKAGDFVLTIQDNGNGIPMELDGKLDRGHGMASMKHRAKQLQGQCLVESGPGYGTVIRLTLPL